MQNRKCCDDNWESSLPRLIYSLVPRPHPSARKKGLVKNDTILGPLRHSGYITTMLIANQLAGLSFTYDHMLDMADQVPCVFAEKIPHRRIEFYLANNWQKYTHSRVTVRSPFNRARTSMSARSRALQD